MFYVPLTGRNAGKRNFETIKKYLKENPDITGVQIAKALKISTATVYSHLKKLQKK